MDNIIFQVEYNEQDKKYRTAFHYACINNNIEAAEILLQHSEINISGNDNRKDDIKFFNEELPDDESKKLLWNDTVMEQVLFHRRHRGGVGSAAWAV